MSEQYDAPLVSAYLGELQKEADELGKDLLSGRNIKSWEQYREKVKAREAFIKAIALMRDLVNKARKGELE